MFVIQQGFYTKRTQGRSGCMLVTVFIIHVNKIIKLQQKRLRNVGILYVENIVRFI